MSTLQGRCEDEMISGGGGTLKTLMPEQAFLFPCARCCDRGSKHARMLKTRFFRVSAVSQGVNSYLSSHSVNVMWVEAMVVERGETLPGITRKVLLQCMTVYRVGFKVWIGSQMTNRGGGVSGEGKDVRNNVDLREWKMCLGNGTLCPPPPKSISTLGPHPSMWQKGEPL